MTPSAFRWRGEVLAEFAGDDLDGLLAGDLAGRLAAHPVGDDAHGQVGELLDVDGVFVVLAVVAEQAALADVQCERHGPPRSGRSRVSDRERGRAVGAIPRRNPSNSFSLTSYTGAISTCRQRPARPAHLRPFAAAKSPTTPPAAGMDAGRVNLVHDWLTGMRGGEKCLDVALPPLARRPSSTPCCTRRGIVSPAHRSGCDIRPSFLNRLPGVDRYYRYLLPLMPAAARWPLAGCDLVRQLQPLRRQGGGPAAGRAARLLLLHADALRLAHAGRVLRGPGPRAEGPGRRPPARPPCATGTGGPPTASPTSSPSARRSRAASASATAATASSSIRRWIPTSTPRPGGAARGLLPRGLGVRPVQAARPGDRGVPNSAEKRLVVIGTGQDDERLEGAGRADDRVPRLAAGRGDPRPPAAVRALLFPGEEDFGIVPVEAQGLRDAR